MESDTRLAGFCLLLVVPGESAAPARPCQRAFPGPSSWPHSEALPVGPPGHDIQDPARFMDDFPQTASFRHLWPTTFLFTPLVRALYFHVLFGHPTHPTTRVDHMDPAPAFTLRGSPHYAKPGTISPSR